MVPMICWNSVHYFIVYSLTNTNNSYFTCMCWCWCWLVVFLKLSQYIISPHLCLIYCSKPNKHATSSMKASLILPSGNHLSFPCPSSTLDLYIPYASYHFIAANNLFVFVFSHFVSQAPWSRSHFKKKSACIG